MEESTVMRTVSRRTHAPFVTVHTKGYTPAIVNPDTAVDGLVGVAIVAVEVVDHKPEAGAGLFPDKLVVLP